MKIDNAINLCIIFTTICCIIFTSISLLCLIFYASSEERSYNKRRWEIKEMNLELELEDKISRIKYIRGLNQERRRIDSALITNKNK